MNTKSVSYTHLYYDLYETPVPEGEEPKSLHARVCSQGTISGKEFMERVFREEHMPHAMVVGIVQAITCLLYTSRCV